MFPTAGKAGNTNAVDVSLYGEQCADPRHVSRIYRFKDNWESLEHNTHRILNIPSE
jgi:hypothetical protein